MCRCILSLNLCIVLICAYDCDCMVALLNFPVGLDQTDTELSTAIWSTTARPESTAHRHFRRRGDFSTPFYYYYYQFNSSFFFRQFLAHSFFFIHNALPKTTFLYPTNRVALERPRFVYISSIASMLSTWPCIIYTEKMDRSRIITVRSNISVHASNSFVLQWSNHMSSSRSTRYRFSSW